MNAVYGFASMLMRLLTDEQPDVIAVAFDTKAPTFRHELFEEYKAHRPPTPSELISQFPLLKEFLRALAVPTIELDGYEADDILATLARRAGREGHEVLVVTGDRDSFQLIDDHVRVMTTRTGISDIVVYDHQAVLDRYGLTPAQVPDFLGLKGDPSDNIPGVPGVGEKTAGKLVQEFGSLKKIYESLDLVKPERIAGLLRENRERAEVGYKLALLDFEVPVVLDFESSSWGGWQPEEVRQAFDRLEFRTLKERFFAKFVQATEDLKPEFTVRAAEVTTTDFLDLLQTGVSLGLGWRLSEDGSVRLSLASAAGEAVTIEVAPPGTLEGGGFAGAFAAALTDSRICLFDVKGLLRIFSLEQARKLDLFDVRLAAYLLDSSSSSYEAGALCEKYLGQRLAISPSDSDISSVDAALTLVLRPIFEDELRNTGMMTLFQKIEAPLIQVLARMEVWGVGLDERYLAEFSQELGLELSSLESDIWTMAGGEFNINSPQQLSRVLFENLGLAHGKKTKSKAAYATDAKVLAGLAKEHPIAGLLSRYRELSKLKSTYVDALPKLISRDTGRLHTTFNQTVTATGRLSSSSPNLQNIPTRTDLGKRIRNAFIPAEHDEILLAADYSQIELRLLAHYSQDVKLTKLFASGADIHTATAAEVFGVSEADVTRELRRRAKAVNFGIVYGISGFGLADQLDIDTAEAAAYIDVYLRRYPGVKDFIDGVLKQAKADGFVTTLAGRRRYLPELKSPSYQVRSFGERAAVNAPLQGSAADIIKKAMLAVDAGLAAAGSRARMVLQVHDELILEVPPDEQGDVKNLLKKEMESAWELFVPLEVDISWGGNWGEL